MLGVHFCVFFVYFTVELPPSLLSSCLDETPLVCYKNFADQTFIKKFCGHKFLWKLSRFLWGLNFMVGRNLRNPQNLIPTKIDYY